jgi:hypothetical protein
MRELKRRAGSDEHGGEAAGGGRRTVEDRLETECDEFRACKAEGHGEGREQREGRAGKGRGGVPAKEREDSASYVPAAS